MSLQGSLRDFPVADVFQMVAQQRKTGVLEVEQAGRALLIYFLEGQVLRARPAEDRPDGSLAAFILRMGLASETDLAEIWRQQEETLESLGDVLVSQQLLSKEELQQVSQLLSDETIFELFLWDDGTFAFRPCKVEHHDGDVLVGAEMVLLDALRMRDEWAQIQGGLPNLSEVISRGVDIEVFREHRAAVEASVGMAPDELERLFTLCDGRLNARRVIDLSRLGTFRGARGLVALLREGLLHVVKVAAKPKGGTRRPGSASSRNGVGVAVLVISVIVASAIFAIPAPVRTSYPLPSVALPKGRDAAQYDRIRMALEAYRWRTGAYPKSLAELGMGRNPLLAPVRLGRYSYSLSGSGYTLQGD